MQLSPDVDAIRTAFGLDEPGLLEPITPEDRGSTVWRLGAFAVKRVRWTAPDWWRREAEVSSEFERLAAESGVRCPRPVVPVEPAVGYFAVIEDAPYRVHEWIDAEPVGSVDIDRWVGATLGSMQQLVRADGPDRQRYGRHSSDEWKEWIEQGRTQRRMWAADADRSRPLITEAGRYVDAALRSCRTFAVCHRDFNPRNVRMTDVPWITDFDSAGPDSPFLEAVSTAMEFAFIGNEEPDVVRIERVLGSYIDAGGVVERIEGAPVLSRWLGSNLMWIAFNMWRSLGHRVTTPVERDDADRIVSEEIAKLRELIDGVERWSKLVRV